MKTFRLIGMALLAVVMCVNFTSCSSDDDDSPIEETDLSKIIIGTWVQDGDDDIMVIKSDGTVTWYGDENDYKNKDASEIYQWEVKYGYLYFYYEGEIMWKMRLKEMKTNIIVWKDYDVEKEHSTNQDDYGYYRLWTWERYSK